MQDHRIIVCLCEGLPECDEIKNPMLKLVGNENRINLLSLLHLKTLIEEPESFFKITLRLLQNVGQSSYIRNQRCYYL